METLEAITSLRQMMVRESETTVDMLASPFGAYTLVRNALDAAVVALWLLEPVNGSLRIKRRIMLVKLARVPRSGKLWGRRPPRRSDALQEVAGLAGLGAWNPLSKNAKLPSTTQMLTDLERWHSNAVLPWLTAWQLASGHAHGKLWAQIASHELQESKELGRKPEPNSR